MSVQFFSDTPIPKRLAIQNFAKKIRANLSKRRTAEEIYVVFVSDNEIRKLNRVFLKHDRPTDVIAFNYTPAKKNLPFGDIYVSLDTARRQAHRQKYPSEQEISLLVLHGLLHLFGYEDPYLILKYPVTLPVSPLSPGPIHERLIFL